MNVTRAVRPATRRQRSGLIVAIHQVPGRRGSEYSSVYAATKAGLEGWMGALSGELAPCGIHTTIVNPGFFPTTPVSRSWRREKMAMSSASTTSAEVIVAGVRQPTMRRENTSLKNAVYANPDHLGT